MAPLQARPAAARIGWLIVAVIHLLTVATLTFAHGHAPTDGTVVVVSTHGEHRDSPAGHPDICVICQTLGASTVTAPSAPVAAEPPHVAIAPVFAATSHTAVHAVSPSSPRAPPRA